MHKAMIILAAKLYWEKKLMKMSEPAKIALSKIVICESTRSLINFYKNTVDSKIISEYEKEVLKDSIEQRMREISPSVATKTFGPKDSEARKFLQAFYDRLADQHDLSRNRVKAGAKVGGSMINGTRFVEIYISYKNSLGVNIGLGWVQEKPDTVRFLTVDVRQVGKGDTVLDENYRFEIGQEDAAREFYEKALLARLDKVEGNS